MPFQNRVYKAACQVAALIFFLIGLAGCASPQAAPPTEQATSDFAGCPAVVAGPEGVLASAYFPPDLHTRITTLLNDLQPVAGLAIAVVHDDQVIYSRAFGYSNLTDCTPVTLDTRFYLKSTTKSFTGVLAALLHEEGVLELDAPITEYLPDLAPPGIEASRLTLRDHLTHTMPYFDSGMNYRSAFVGMDPSEYVPHINTWARPTDTRLQYSNVGPIVAAHAIGSAAGVSWRDLLEDRIFAPLGMHNSFAYMSKAKTGPIARVYVLGEDVPFEPTVIKDDSQMHAAGGTVSTVQDLSRWLMASLNDGRIGNEKLLPSFAFQQAHARIVNLDVTYYKFHRFAHGLGHFIADYEGDILVHHFGGETHVSFMPEHGLGIAILSNQIQGGAFTTHRIAALLYDILLKKEDLELRWQTATTEIRDALENSRRQKAARIQSLIDAAPDVHVQLPPADLQGTYQNDRLGDITFSLVEGELKMQFGALSGTLAFIRGNAYLADFAPWGGPPELFIFSQTDNGFQMDWGGRIFSVISN